MIRVVLGVLVCGLRSERRWERRTVSEILGVLFFFFLVALGLSCSRQAP